MAQYLESINFRNHESYINARKAKRFLNQCNQVMSYFSDNNAAIKAKVGDYEYNWLIQNVDLIIQRVTLLKSS